MLLLTLCPLHGSHLLLCLPKHILLLLQLHAQRTALLLLLQACRLAFQLGRVQRSLPQTCVASRYNSGDWPDMTILEYNNLCS